MANIRYFSDFNNESVECVLISTISNEEYAKLFPGVCGLRYDGYSKIVGSKLNDTFYLEIKSDYLPVTRKIEYKSNPSKHKCNAKCLGGKINGTCECSCEGKNHGAGTSFTALINRDKKSPV